MERKREPEGEQGEVARAWQSPLAVVVLCVVATLYLAGVWLDSVTKHATAKRVPRPVVYFTQIAELFTHSASVDRKSAWKAGTGTAATAPTARMFNSTT